MTDGAISLLSYTLGEWSGQGILPERGSEMLTGGYACYNIYKTRDNKFISLGAIEDKFWRNFCLRIDRPDYIQLQWAREKQKNLIDDIKAIFIEKYQQEWLDIFSDLDICLTPVLTLEEMSEHPQVKEREMLIKLPDYQNSGRDLFMAGIPIKLSSTPGELKVQFPEVGQHTMSILQKAGYNEMEIVELKEQGIIKY
ncbi:alpha-methylacyl-coa racemase [hydrocarbon metagenome]|uniref:Alpha-methylacyl-coa racemase n=1 Tax=hydrocarbon metagenome TaxID=938273 RepID=A0A0W8E279_9ZZZZ